MAGFLRDGWKERESEIDCLRGRFLVIGKCDKFLNPLVKPL